MDYQALTEFSSLQVDLYEIFDNRKLYRLYTRGGQGGDVNLPLQVGVALRDTLLAFRFEMTSATSG